MKTCKSLQKFHLLIEEDEFLELCNKIISILNVSVLRIKDGRHNNSYFIYKIRKAM